MSSSTSSQPAPTCKPVRRGFGPLTCIKCGAEASVQLDLDDVENCTCRECSEEFSLTEVRAVLANWSRVLEWIDNAPTLPE